MESIHTCRKMFGIFGYYNTPHLQAELLPAVVQPNRLMMLNISALRLRLPIFVLVTQMSILSLPILCS
jgi:hypothetical protein